MSDTPMVTGWRCEVCGATVDIAEPLAWRCPRATGGDRRHELRMVGVAGPHPAIAERPFLDARRHLAWDAYAASLGLGDEARHAVLDRLDGQVAAVAGTGFQVTPFGRDGALSDALGFSVQGGVWVKDETGNVGGSHKARHLFTILAHLVVTEQTGRAPWRAGDRPSLAIASCGNAAIAASTLARAADWPIRVFVPEWADEAVVATLAGLGASIVRCPRRRDDPPGDPCVLRFREAVAAGSIPFGVQGPENGWCLDGGRTIGWEIGAQLGGAPLDRVVVQVGGGALGACLAAGLAEAGVTARVHAMQTEACAPLARAWSLLGGQPADVAPGAVWGEVMWPWSHVGSSAADGILDDETYDWVPLVGAMRATGGGPVVSDEAAVLCAHQLVRDVAGINASATGTAGIAGLLTMRANGEVGDDERVAVIVSGVARGG